MKQLFLMMAVVSVSTTHPILAEEKGADLYEEICAACHKPSNIMVPSPKAGIREDWIPRLKNGFGATLRNASMGINAMPPRGGCDICSDEDIQAALEYMLADTGLLDR